jgi:hypothetical protein
MARWLPSPSVSVAAPASRIPPKWQTSHGFHAAILEQEGAEDRWEWSLLLKAVRRLPEHEMKESTFTKSKGSWTATRTRSTTDSRSTTRSPNPCYSCSGNTKVPRISIWDSLELSWYHFWLFSTGPGWVGERTQKCRQLAQLWLTNQFTVWLILRFMTYSQLITN